MNITLIGMPGSGKSTVGKILARRLGLAFLDVDPLIVERYGARTLQQVLDALGGEAFLDLEAQVCASLQVEDTVIAPGGSAVLREEGIRHLKSLGPVVYLELPANELEKRLGNLATRGVPLAPGQTVAGLLEYRRPFYETWADLTVPGQASPEDTAEAVVRALRL